MPRELLPVLAAAIGVGILIGAVLTSLLLALETGAG